MLGNIVVRTTTQTLRWRNSVLNKIRKIPLIRKSPFLGYSIIILSDLDMDAYCILTNHSPLFPPLLVNFSLV